MPEKNAKHSAALHLLIQKAREIDAQREQVARIARDHDRQAEDLGAVVAGILETVRALGAPETMDEVLLSRSVPVGATVELLSAAMELGVPRAAGS